MEPARHASVGRVRDAVRLLRNAESGAVFVEKSFAVDVEIFDIDVIV